MFSLEAELLKVCQFKPAGKGRSKSLSCHQHPQWHRPAIEQPWSSHEIPQPRLLAGSGWAGGQEALSSCAHTPTSLPAAVRLDSCPNVRGFHNLCYFCNETETECFRNKVWMDCREKKSGFFSHSAHLLL